ncbi:viroplasmin family protein [Candidatus Clostridium stratigraminis]|uniref:Viroplasmin family protein n=1 Tax=Candidatus Clostridium stratigraminis TaxID=3381661 RepID=A0ABW8T671_9CLOT
MSKKVYAIKEGFDSVNNIKVENIIVNSWSECLSYVNGVKGAKYKSFESLDKAENYLRDDNKLLRKGIDSYPLDCIHAYVDGSYNEATGKYSYGLIITKGEVVQYAEAGSAIDDSEKALRQIAGELKASVRAVEYAACNSEKDIVIFHDYEGIYHHAVGTWERKEESSKNYYETINNIKSRNNINIIFVKVDSHTGDLNNEIADELAKYAAGLNSTGVVKTWLNTKTIMVKDNNVKNYLSKIAGDNSKNIISRDNKNV